MKVAARGKCFDILYDENKNHYFYMVVPYPFSKARFKTLKKALYFSKAVERRINK